MLTIALLDWSIRASLLLVAGYLIARGLASVSAAMAHRVLVATVGCILLVPLAAAVVPSWQWTKPTWTSVRTVEVDGDSQIPQATVDSPSTASAFGTQFSFPDAAQLQRGVESTAADELPQKPVSDNVAETLASSSTATRELSQSRITTPPATRSTRSAWTWLEWAAVLWLAVAGLLMGRVCLSIVRLWKFVSSCAAASEGVVRMVEDVALRLELRHRVVVVLSNSDAMPKACWLG